MLVHLVDTDLMHVLLLKPESFLDQLASRSGCTSSRREQDGEEAHGRHASYAVNEGDC